MKARLIVPLLLLATAVGIVLQAQRPVVGRYSQPVRIASLTDPRVIESSGLGASWRNPGIYWTHNDSGDEPLVYAFDRSGASRGTWRVRGAQALDWEDMAVGPGPDPNLSYLYLADFGDNNRRRTEAVLYRVPEPEVAAAGAGSLNPSPRLTEPAEAIHFRYQSGVPHNAEALLVHPDTGDVYIVTKISTEQDPKTLVYRARAPLSGAQVVTFDSVATLKVPDIWRRVVGFQVPVPGVITGGDISPDGRRVILATYANGFELTLPDGAPFDDIWRQPLVPVPLGARQGGESVTYRRDGLAILAGSEGRNSPLYEMVRTH